MSSSVILICGPELAAYGFPSGHPFGPDRHDAFIAELEQSDCWSDLEKRAARQATREEIEYFHSREYVNRVIEFSIRGSGFLDRGDTPAYAGIYEAAANVVGGTLNALAGVMEAPGRRAFIPIGGLHHAARGAAAGFCVFNDCGVAIEAARRTYGIRRVAYVDIDAHHGDGVFYGFEDDPDVLIADVHEDGRFLYPGTGSRSETGKAAAFGTKLNIPMPPGADDSAFFAAWQEVEEYLERGKPELVLLQCGADCLGGDPITHLGYTEEIHAHAARSVKRIADRHCSGRLLAMGGGGYNRANLARAWTRVVEELAAD